MAELTRVKNKRGGQQGNQNARKHGFYSDSLTSDEIGRFWHIISQEHTSPEMAILRIKLQSLVNHAPSHRVFSQVAMLIVRWSVKKYRLNRSDRAYLKAAVENALEQYYGISEVREHQQINLKNESPRLVPFESFKDEILLTSVKTYALDGRGSG